jgi:formylmethanofuran dehydrogenase subunit E
MNRNDEVYKIGLALHGHKCPAMPLGLRAGEAAMQALGVQHAPDGQLTALVEIDRNHCSTCFADGVQVTTGCTFGKGNIEKSGEGKFAVTLVDKGTDRAVRVAYKPTLQSAIRATSFMQKRSAGVPASQIPDEEQLEVVHLVWDAPEADIMTVGPVHQRAWTEPEEVVRFGVCPSCGELVAEPYLRVAEGKTVCGACSGYPR